MAKYCIGIDLGGTFIKFGVMDADSAGGQTLQLPTPTDRGSAGVIEQIVDGARQVMQINGVRGQEVLGVGIGSPGPIDLSEGVILSLPNIPGMESCPLRDAVGEALELPAVLENDANAAAYGEYIGGAGKEAADMVMLTLGTGVGSGIIINGHILHGAHEIGGELGHMIVDPGGEACNCGQRGCLERYSSARYLADYARRLIEQGRPSALQDVLNEAGQIDAADINAHRQQGDALAAEVWDRAVFYLAIGCVNICRIFDPDRIVLAGGMTKAGEDLLGPLEAHFQRNHWSLSGIRTELALAEIGSDAGVLGAAGVAWSAFGGH